MGSRDSQWERLPAVAVKERCKPLVPEQGCSQSMCMSQGWVCVCGGGALGGYEAGDLSSVVN